jgi:hypothetical protein
MMASAKDRGMVVCDDKGRIQLTKEDRERYGERFIVVRTSRAIWLYPRSDDPVAALAELGKSLPPDVSIRELRRMALEQGLKDAMRKANRVRRH